MKKIAEGNDKTFVLATDYKKQLRQALRDKRDEFEKLLAEYVEMNPTMTHVQIADRFGINRQDVARVATKYGVNRTRGAGSPASTQYNTAKA